MMQIHYCTLRPFMLAALFYSFLCFCYVLDVCNEPPRTLIGVLFNPKLMKFGSFPNMKLCDSFAMLVLTLMIC
jgi:hypothetical protein